MRSVLLLSLLSRLFDVASSSACFAQSPWKNIRSLVAMIDSCSTTADCENECLAISQCDAYVFSTRCALFGVDSGKPQCVQSGKTFWQRLPVCGGALPATTLASASTTTTIAASLPTMTTTTAQTTSKTSAAATTTSSPTTTTTRVSTTTTSGTTTTTKPTTTTTTVGVSPCGVLVYQQSVDCAGGCPSPTMGIMETTCTSRYTLYVNGNGQSNLTCVGTDWTYVYMGSPYTFAPGSTVYCVNTMG